MGRFRAAGRGCLAAGRSDLACCEAAGALAADRSRGPGEGTGLEPGLGCVVDEGASPLHCASRSGRLGLRSGLRRARAELPGRCPRPAPSAVYPHGQGVTPPALASSAWAPSARRSVPAHSRSHAPRGNARRSTLLRSRRGDARACGVGPTQSMGTSEQAGAPYPNARSHAPRGNARLRRSASSGAETQRGLRSGSHASTGASEARRPTPTTLAARGDGHQGESPRGYWPEPGTFDLAAGGMVMPAASAAARWGRASAVRPWAR